MIKGLYTSASAMLANRENMSITANNLANANTDGYKKEGITQKTFSEMLISKINHEKKSKPIGKLGTGVSLHESYTNFKAGELEHTGGKLDLAIKGRGFFVIQTPAGKRYTRNGNFTLNKQGQIVTQKGYALLNEKNRPIQTLPKRDVNVDNKGNLHFEDLTGSKIKIVDFADYSSLTKVGDNQYRLSGTDKDSVSRQAEDYLILDGYLEKSNVNIVEEMLNMIKVTRLYESNQKVISSIDNTLDKAVNSVGRLR